MMELSNNDKARLATELCGGKMRSDSCSYRKNTKVAHRWQFPKHADVRVAKFDPLHNGVHTLMVLDGLRKKVYHVDIRLGKGNGPIIIKLYKSPTGAIQNTPDIKLIEGPHFPSAVVAAGLEVLGKEGGK